MNRFIYTRNATSSTVFDRRHGSSQWNNWPCLIVDAEDLKAADQQFEQITGLKAAKLPHVGVRWEPR